MYKLLANIKINLKFYRRNKFLLVALIFIIAILGLSMIPTIFFFTKTKYFEIVKMIFFQLSWFATIITGALGLFFISHHIGNHSTKMVFTKPCPPEVWLLSGFLSAIIVSLFLYIVIFFICSILFIIWNIPFQWGIIYVVFNDFLKTIIVLSYIIFLTILFHPVIAVLLVVIFREGNFYFAKILLMSKIEESKEGLSIFLKILKGLVDIVYMALPCFSPYFKETSRIYSSFRILDVNFLCLFLTLVYTLCISVFFYFLSNYFLKKKRHI